jgi:hypothetical protein
LKHSGSVIRLHHSVASAVSSISLGLGKSISEVPVRWNDSPGTKVRFLRDLVGMLWDLVTLRWRAVQNQFPS